MKHLLLALALFVICGHTQAQQYIPMPTDSATWRYRAIDLDDTSYLVIDVLLLVSGHDTTINGTSYHIVFSRSHAQTIGASAYPPPVVDDTCLYPDVYYTAVRESGKKVYEWTGSTEKLMYDFNAQTGSTVPAPGVGNVTVTGIDSVLLGGVWHKRYNTNNTAYYIIEGVGSSIGLLPSYYGLGTIFFHCFTNPQFHFSPAGAPNCTTIYPRITTAVTEPATHETITLYPVPFGSELHITTGATALATLYSIDGRQVLPPATVAAGSSSINTAILPAGMYYLLLRDARGQLLKTEKLVKEQ